MKKLYKVLIAMLVSLLIVSYVAWGKVAPLTAGLFWYVAAALVFVKGIQAIRKGKLTVTPSWEWGDDSKRKREVIECQKDPMRFWSHLFWYFLISVVATVCGIYGVSTD
jgi:predicted membrane channel-forming protein YqfA (hemolysin III family)